MWNWILLYGFTLSLATFIWGLISHGSDEWTNGRTIWSNYESCCVRANKVFCVLQKTGKWNAMHVRIAWEIYHHQQKQATEAKVVGGSVGPPKADLLRPPTHLFPPRPHDMSHFTAPHRAPHPFDASPHPGSGPFQTLGKLLDSDNNLYLHMHVHASTQIS